MKNLASKYKDEISELLDLDDFDFNIPNQDLSLMKSKLGIESKMPQKSSKEWKGEIAPYTFDPRSIIQSLSKPILEEHKIAPEPPEISNISTVKESISTISKTPYKAIKSELSSISNSKYPSPKINLTEFDYIKELNSSLLKDINPSSKVQKNPSKNTLEEDVRELVREFDNEFGDHRSEIEKLLQKLESRVKSIQSLSRDMNNPNTKLDYMKNRIFNELKDAQEGLTDANNNIIVLMNERANIRERFCTVKARNRELKNYNKIFQENIRTYFIIITIDAKLNTANYQKIIMKL